MALFRLQTQYLDSNSSYSCPPSLSTSFSSDSSSFSSLSSPTSASSASSPVSSTSSFQFVAPKQSTLLPFLTTESSPNHWISPSSHPFPISQSTLTPAESEQPRRTPRPPNSFILYRKEQAAKFSKMTAARLSRILGDRWSREPLEVKAHYARLAKVAEQEHFQKHPEYKFTPAKRGTGKKARALRIAANTALKTAAVAAVASLIDNGSVFQFSSASPSSSFTSIISRPTTPASSSAPTCLSIASVVGHPPTGNEVYWQSESSFASIKAEPSSLPRSGTLQPFRILDDSTSFSSPYRLTSSTISSTLPCAEASLSSSSCYSYSCLPLVTVASDSCSRPATAPEVSPSGSQTTVSVAAGSSLFFFPCGSQNHWPRSSTGIPQPTAYSGLIASMGNNYFSQHCPDASSFLAAETTLRKGQNSHSHGHKPMQDEVMNNSSIFHHSHLLRDDLLAKYFLDDSQAVGTDMLAPYDHYRHRLHQQQHHDHDQILSPPVSSQNHAAIPSTITGAVIVPACGRENSFFEPGFAYVSPSSQPPTSVPLLSAAQVPFPFTPQTLVSGETTYYPFSTMKSKIMPSRIPSSQAAQPMVTSTMNEHYPIPVQSMPVTLLMPSSFSPPPYMT